MLGYISERGIKMEVYKTMAALLSSEFDRYLVTHATMAKRLPKNALIVFQVMGEERFNRWSEKIALQYRGVNQPIVYVKIRDFHLSSVLKNVMLEKIAV